MNDDFHTTADPDAPRVGTAKSPGERPGARKRGPKRRRSTKEEPYTPEEKRERIQARIAREIEKEDFSRRCVELRRLNKSYQEIAEQMAIELGYPVNRARVRQHVLNMIRNTDAIQDVRYQELDLLQSQAGNLRQKLADMDELSVALLDLEMYTKVAETYLKYRERIAKLVGLDAATKTQVSRDGAPPPGMPLDGGSVHIGPDGITVRMPGSVTAYEDWEALDEKGLINLAGEVLELEAGSHAEDDVAMFHADGKAGTTLAPHVDLTPVAERRASALEALAAFTKAQEAAEAEAAEPNYEDAEIVS